MSHLLSEVKSIYLPLGRTKTLPEQILVPAQKSSTARFRMAVLAIRDGEQVVVCQVRDCSPRAIFFGSY